VTKPNHHLWRDGCRCPQRMQRTHVACWTSCHWGARWRSVCIGVCVCLCVCVCVCACWTSCHWETRWRFVRTVGHSEVNTQVCVHVRIHVTKKLIKHLCTFMGTHATLNTTHDRKLNVELLLARKQNTCFCGGDALTYNK